jgi:pimeloyl-ACP methyl ester carboxylesterase
MPLVPPPPRAIINVAADDGAVLRVRRHGRGNGLRLFVSHGNGFATDGYLPFWAPLLRDFDVVVFDMRNHGRNPLADPADHSYPQFARDFASLLRAIDDAFGAKPAVGLFHSMSAQTAMRHALEYGWRWEALVLFDPPNVPPPGHPVHAPMAAFEHRLARWAHGRRSRFADPRELADDYARTRAGGDWVAGAHALMARSVLRRDPVVGDWALRCPPELEEAIYLDGITLGLWPRQADFAGPVKLIAADPDLPRPAPTALSNQALAREGGFDYRAIPGTGHLLQLEKPEACGAVAIEFLKELGLA